MTYQFFEYNGTRIHYELRGQGTAVTFIHAGVANLDMWDDQMEAFAAGHQTLRYDVRGWGWTARPDVSFSNHDDLRALLYHLGIEKTAIVGCSWGGKIALDFALTYPDMVNAIILVGTGLGGYEWTFAGFAEKTEAMVAAYEAGDKAAAAELQTQIWFDGPARTLDQVDAGKRRRAYEMVLHTFELPEGEGEHLDIEPPALERLADIQLPVRILVGEYDVPDVHTIAAKLEAELPLAEERTILLGTAHLPNMERPSRFNKIVLGFLDKLEWQSDIYAILPHEQEAKVWLVPDKQGFALPHLTLPGGQWDTTEAQVQRPWQHKLGSVQVLYRAHFEKDDEAQTTQSVFVLDNLGAELSDGRWFDRQSLAAAPLANPMHQPLIENSLQEWETGQVPPQRPPWARRGWLAQAEAWIEETLKQQGRPVASPLEVVRNWSLSYVMRVKTDHGDHYFKTVAKLPLFVNEARFVETLVGLFPQAVLTPTAVQTEQDWMLLPALERIINWGAPLPQRLDFIRRFARLQQTAVVHEDALLAAGCLDRRLPWMEQQLEPLIQADICREGLNENEVVELISLIPRLRDVCTALAGAAVPQSLVHGDLHGGNVGWQNGNIFFFDWTDACLSHPFFDMIDIFYEEDTAVQTQLRDAYLNEWTAFASMRELLKIWHLAEIGAAIHHAISYWQILVNIEPRARGELEHMLPFWLRKIILNFGETIDK